MDGVGSMLGAAGGCPEIVVKRSSASGALDDGGKTWKIGHPTQRAKATLERLAVAKATQEITALKGVVDPATYAEMFAGHRSDIAAGSYRTWGEGWQRVTFSPVNAHLFLLSLLRENHPEASEQDARALAMGNQEEVEIALLQVVPGFFTMLLEEAPFPPEKKQEAQNLLQSILQQLSPRSRPSPVSAT